MQNLKWDTVVIVFRKTKLWLPNPQQIMRIIETVDVKRSVDMAIHYTTNHPCLSPRSDFDFGSRWLVGICHTPPWLVQRTVLCYINVCPYLWGLLGTQICRQFVTTKQISMLPNTTESRVGSQLFLIHRQKCSVNKPEMLHN